MVNKETLKYYEDLKLVAQKEYEHSEELLKFAKDKKLSESIISKLTKERDYSKYFVKALLIHTEQVKKYLNNIQELD